MYFYTCLVVSGSRKYLRATSGNSCIFFNQFGINASHSFDTKRKRDNIEKQNIFDVPRNNTSLDSSAKSHNFIWINGLVWSFAKKLFHFLHNFWHSGLTTDKDYFIYISYFKRTGFQSSLCNFH